jgi:hypothetical protein
MDRSRYSIRPFLDTEFESMARLARELDPEHAGTAGEFRHWDELTNLKRDHVNLKVVAEERGTGEFVGWGSLAPPLYKFDLSRFWSWVAVALGHRQRGIRGELFALLEGEALARNGLGVWGNTMETDPAGVRFLQQGGFRILRKVWRSRLDLTTLDLSTIPDWSSSLEGEGIRFSTLAEKGATSPETLRGL